MVKAAVVPMRASTSSVSLRVLILDDDHDPRELALRVGGRTIPVPADGWRSFDEGRRVLRYRNCVADGLEAGRRHDVVLGMNGNVIAACTATTLPTADQPCGIIIGSCCADDGPIDDIKSNYRTVTEPLLADGIAPLNIWCGDQVYVDAPWTSGFWRADPRRVILDKYLNAWGLEGVSGGPAKQGLAHALAQGSNWFLPDDHEFWNGYPHPSFFTLPAHTVGRLAVQVYRRFKIRRRPPHPAAQWSWARTAGEAYCLFQSSLDFESFDEEVTPEQIQTIDLGNASIVMVDTRWHRTIRKAGKRAGFMRAEDMAALIKTLNSDDRLLCLALAKPIIGYLPHQGSIRTEAEYSPEDFVAQYLQLWAALRDRAERGWPTLVVGGDVHRQSFKSAFDDRLLEVVSSPLAGLEALSKWYIRMAERGWVGAKKGLRALTDRRTGRTRPDNADGVAYPIVVGAPEDNDWVPGEARRPVGDDPLIELGGELSSGLISLRIDAADRERPRIRVETVANLRQTQKKGRMPTVPARHRDTHEFEWNGAWKAV